MKMVDEEIFFFDKHIARLQKGMKILKMNLTSQSLLAEKSNNHTNEIVDGLKSKILQIAKKNNHSNSCKIRLQVFRDGIGEGYTPNCNDAKYIIETSILSNKKYEHNSTGIILGLYSDIKKPQNILSNIKTSNALYSVLAGIYAKENQIDDCLLLNESGYISEAISSNIFIIKNDIIYTPSLNQGCIDGIMRNNVIEQARKTNISVVEKQITIDEVKNADEVFLTNVIKGIVSVKSFMRSNYKPQNIYSKYALSFDVVKQGL
ncbi:MAG: hypothetical protein A3K10_02760 [Bacteroidetes bacterium RIFCSPLOWO2_12_FULL_31_6]|nr:MAG: hypothetical protein A3K10_02760 [Bacteroidetes bacterium RIFCSPLOWO2_12_FULL_31_6]